MPRVHLCATVPRLCYAGDGTLRTLCTLKLALYQLSYTPRLPPGLFFSEIATLTTTTTKKYQKMIGSPAETCKRDVTGQTGVWHKEPTLTPALKKQISVSLKLA